jgi:hypothetical protein
VVLVEYEKEKKISDDDFVLINIKGNQFHGEWNYRIKPEIKKQCKGYFCTVP